MFFCGTPECPSGTTELGRMSDGKSEIAKFGEACMSGHRVLCCKDEVVGADPGEHCHFFNSITGSQVCAWGKETIATEDKTYNVVIKHYRMLCCDPEVLGAEKKETFVLEE
ncbi:hypothetical protein PRIPAC_75670 [Pristionchus pacificus]|uniref:Uncharacterized protein n=1 Tax=Pristionchus pacificus TaxID=54126 RepID=A0A2A6D041_PRIPA|nr:hypothetical protein PRIPAC_75670 [Pristionchus pacificus]|eukprot:PDM83748.1 hypothetical protein PRIPAC_30235 [Pristionchus pacificus]